MSDLPHDPLETVRAGLTAARRRELHAVCQLAEYDSEREPRFERFRESRRREGFSALRAAQREVAALEATLRRIDRWNTEARR